MMSIPGHFFSVFFVLGLLVIFAYGWQRFNEPSFPDHETLPRTVAPLRFLFLGSAYWKARLAYIAASLLLYCLLVWPGESVKPALGLVGVKDDFPTEAWALLVALLLVGLIPNSNMKWLTVVEETLRRWVHAWFLVPDGIMRTIGVLEDAPYEPPSTQLNSVINPQLREKLRSDLRLPTNSLQYHWARAQMLMESLKQMGAGAAHPLQRAAFAPFEGDFDAIRTRYRALEKDIDSLSRDGMDENTEETLIRSVDRLLRQIYAYLSWGIRQQASTERQIDRLLEDLGFRVPRVSGPRLLDVVAPTVLLIGAFTLLFWIIVHAARATLMSRSVIYAVVSAIAASVMYGSAVFIALNQRSTLIERKVWREGSPKCFIPIAVKAGLVSWLVIVATTVLFSLDDVVRKVNDLLGLFQPFDAASESAGATLAEMVVPPLPWFLAGATVSVAIAWMIGGDVRRTGRRQRIQDAVILGVALGIAAAVATLIQVSLSEYEFNREAVYDDVPIVGLAGAVCGTIIGFMVPQACRANLVTPQNRIIARALRDLLARAEAVLGSKAAAEDWVFMPRAELEGITPAEAMQHKGYATGVVRLLEDEESPRPDAMRPERGVKLTPVVLEGGRSASSSAA